jgi:hypothetical protein
MDQIKKDPKASFFKKNNVIIQAKYVDKNGRDVVTTYLAPSEY